MSRIQCNPKFQPSLHTTAIKQYKTTKFKCQIVEEQNGHHQATSIKQEDNKMYEL